MKLIALALLACTLPAQAAILAVASDTKGARVELHDEQGICVGPAKLARYVAVDQSTVVAGCWVAAGPRVQIAFLDGDVMFLPASAFGKPREG